MTQRCIFLVPETDRLERIQRLRSRHDPLADAVPPHLTVVFPFTIDWPPERLAALLDGQAKALPIPFAFGEPVERDGWMYFPLTRGAAQVAALHTALYALLPPRLRSDRPFVPHVTFGQRSGRPARDALREAAEVLPCMGTLRRMVLERIGRQGLSILEHEVSS
jgi:2'-5' RNA ligase